jgi:1-acyl-sn-glycerol-3-phosphate acyltransferase
MGVILAVTRIAILATVYGFFAGVGALIHLQFRNDEKARLQRLVRATQYLAKISCRVLNIRARVEGAANILPGCLIVANHVGTPDILVLAACVPMCFVARADFSTWPFLGLLVRLGETLLIDKTRRQDMPAVVEKMRARLQQNVAVTVFPEGGVTNGEDVAPFRSLAFASAVAARRRVTPVALRYHDARRPSIACWQGANFTGHIWAILKNPRLDVSVSVLPALPPGEDRKVLARLCHEQVRGAWRKLGSTNA